MDDIWRVIVREAVAQMIAYAPIIIGIAMTGLVGKLNGWLEAKKHGELVGMVALGNTALQSAAKNYADRIAGAIRRGEIDPTDMGYLKREFALGEASIRAKMPDTVAIVKPAPGAVADVVDSRLQETLNTAAVPELAATPAPIAPSIVTPSPVKVAPDRAAFFNAVRVSVFGGHLVQSQVDGCERMLDFWNAITPDGDKRFLSYDMATACWETGRTMQPIEEYGRGAGRFYGPSGFYGRGLVQITLEDNYRRMSAIAGCDLVKSPERALEWPIALKILFVGMANGMFTGKKLSDYFNDHTDDPVGARAIVNGTDRAEEIAALHHGFLAALAAAEPSKLAA